MGWLAVRWVLQPRRHGKSSATRHFYDVWSYHNQYRWRSGWFHPIRCDAYFFPACWHLPWNQRPLARDRKTKHWKVESKSWIWEKVEGKGRPDEGDPRPGCHQGKGCWYRKHSLWHWTLQAKARSVRTLNSLNWDTPLPIPLLFSDQLYEHQLCVMYEFKILNLLTKLCPYI